MQAAFHGLVAQSFPKAKRTSAERYEALFACARNVLSDAYFGATVSRHLQFTTTACPYENVVDLFTTAKPILELEHD